MQRELTATASLVTEILGGGGRARPLPASVAAELRRLDDATASRSLRA
jgi:hypothetical protein